MTAKCMAILMAVERWRHYIEHYQFIIKSGHKSLKFLLEQRKHTLIQREGLTKLLGLKYTIQYRKRKENTLMAMADALSRRVEDEASNDSGEVMDGCLTTISTVSPV